MASEKDGFTIEGDWERDFKRFIGVLGGLSTSWRRSAPDVQNAAAMIVAELYRAFIRRGISPENTNLTQILHGIHPPLSGLADYIVVHQTGPERGTGTYPGRPKPALVTWHPDWVTIAFLHDRGYMYFPTEAQRTALFSEAEKIAGGREHFLEEGFGSNGVWIVPARPHIHFLSSPELNNVLLRVAEGLLAGRMPKLGGRRPPSEPWKPKKTVRIDDLRHL